MSDVDDTSSVGSIDDIHYHGPPGKRRKQGMSAQGLTYGIEDFKIRSGGGANIEQFKAKVNSYEEQGLTVDKAVHLTANDDLSA